jgi:hypothetical protein
MADTNPAPTGVSLNNGLHDLLTKVSDGEAGETAYPFVGGSASRIGARSFRPDLEKQESTDSGSPASL